LIPGYLTRLLADAPVVESDYGPARLECRTIGELHLPSGRVVACDPLVEPDARPFEVAAAPGRYPVVLGIARLPGGDERIAAAWLRLADGTPVRWEPAALHGRPDLEEPAYGVDSGTGAFVSAEAAPLLAAALDGDFADEVATAMDANYVDTRNWAVLPVPGSAELNFAAFSSGMGDGAYASYWGRDAEGRPVCLLTDFDILKLSRAEAEAEAERDRATAKPWWKLW